MGTEPTTSSQYPVDLSPGQHFQFSTNNGTPMVLTMLNKSNANDAYYSAFASIDGAQWTRSGDLAPTAQIAWINDFRGNPVTVFNTTNPDKPATITATIVGTMSTT